MRVDTDMAAPSGHGGSVYYASKLLQPAQPVKVYLPLALQALVLPRADEIGLRLLPQPLPGAALSGVTEMQMQVEDALNAAFLTVRHAGAEFAQTLRKSLRQLCRQQVDAMYLSLDMADPGTPAAAEAAPWRWALSLQV